MANVFVNLPLPAFNGPGPSINTSTMGKTKTIVVAGSFPGALLTIECSVDPTVFAPVCSFQGNEKKVVDVAAEFMRVTVSGRKTSVPFAANIDASSNDDGMLSMGIPLPAGNGVGPAVPAGALGTFNTFITGGTFDGARILVEISEDGIDYAPCVLFAGQGGLVSKTVTAAFYRASVSGRRAGVPFTGSLAVGAVIDPSPGAGLTNWQSFDYVATGLEGQAFTVPIPVAQPDALYQVRWAIGPVFRQFQLDWLPASRLVAAFDVELSTEPHEGDIIHFDVFNPPP